MEAEKLLNILQSIGLTLATEDYLSPMLTVLRLRHPSLAACHLKTPLEALSSLIHLLSKSVLHRFRQRVTPGKIPT